MPLKAKAASAFLAIILYIMTVFTQKCKRCVHSVQSRTHNSPGIASSLADRIQPGHADRLIAFTVTDNPAWCVLDFMTRYNGCGMSLDEIDVQSFIDGAKFFKEKNEKSGLFITKTVCIL